MKLKREEWDFSLCPDSEVLVCRRYEHSREQYKTFGKAGLIWPEFKEWPSEPYLCIEPVSRAKRVREYPDGSEAEILQRYDWLDAGDVASGTFTRFIADVPWSFTDAELIAAFAKWVKKNRPGKEPKRPTKTARASDILVAKHELKLIAVRRLWNHFDKHGSTEKLKSNATAIQYLGDQFLHASAWSRAKNLAAKLFSVAPY